MEEAIKVVKMVNFMLVHGWPIKAKLASYGRKSRRLLVYKEYGVHGIEGLSMTKVHTRPVLKENNHKENLGLILRKGDGVLPSSVTDHVVEEKKGLEVGGQLMNKDKCDGDRIIDNFGTSLSLFEASSKVGQSSNIQLLKGEVSNTMDVLIGQEAIVKVVLVESSPEDVSKALMS
ncbi:hypothetical protein Q3G72_021525 [Acer saccharum]|nr:hypothetical protein Q3G72_021525 [Acer saccharum]